MGRWAGGHGGNTADGENQSGSHGDGVLGVLAAESRSPRPDLTPVKKAKAEKAW
jgi:hypothetical protein